MFVELSSASRKHCQWCDCQAFRSSGTLPNTHQPYLNFKYNQHIYSTRVVRAILYRITAVLAGEDKIKESHHVTKVLTQ